MQSQPFRSESGRRLRRQKSDWREVVGRYVESGLPQRAFAEAEGISLSTLQYQLRKLSAEEEEGTASAVEYPAVSLLEVSVDRSQQSEPRREATPPACELDLPSGIRLRFFTGFAEADARRLLSIVKEEGLN